MQCVVTVVINLSQFVQLESTALLVIRFATASGRFPVIALPENVLMVAMEITQDYRAIQVINTV